MNGVLTRYKGYLNKVFKGSFLSFISLLAFVSFFSSVSVKAQTFSFKIPLGEPTLSMPAGTAVDSTENIYVVSQSTHQIVKLSSAGVELMKIGSFGSADGQFNSPRGVAVDSSGNIIVADSNNNRIQVFAPPGPDPPDAGPPPGKGPPPGRGRP